MLSATDHFVQENTTLLGRTCEANGWPFHRRLRLSWRVCPWVVKLSFSNKCFSDRWLPCASINVISKHSWCERGGDGGLLRGSAQALSNVFFSQSKRAFLSNLLMSLQVRNIRFRQGFLLKSVNKRPTFFQWQECFLDFLFFSRNYAWNTLFSLAISVWSENNTQTAVTNIRYKRILFGN